jgi:glycosyltransferase involved in cell wall biosynthesis
LKVLFFNASAKGGAAIAAQRIFKALLPLVPDMQYYSLDGNTDTHFRTMPPFKAENGANSIVNRLKWSLYYRQLGKITQGKLGKYEKFTLAHLPIETPVPTDFGMPDLVHLHWTSEMIDYPSFFKSLPKHVPVVWTCHDMNPFTGGCHYTWGCEGFEKQCQHCPQLAISGAKDASYQGQQMKLQSLNGHPLHIVGNSHWMEVQARKSSVFGSALSFQTIHNPLNTDEYIPIDKELAKMALGLPLTAKVIAFGAERFDNERKGFSLLMAALKKVYAQQPDAYCVVFGMGQSIDEAYALPPMRYIGFVESVWLQRVIYSAADVFVIPSQQEAFGQTALEAMACGTPAIGFDVGGIGDMIVPGETGLLAPAGNHEALATAITSLLQNNEMRLGMGAKARMFAVENFNMLRQGEQYFELYKTAVAKGKRNV